MDHIRGQGEIENITNITAYFSTGSRSASLFFSLVMECIGIAFFWPEQGAAHSQQMMQLLPD